MSEVYTVKFTKTLQNPKIRELSFVMMHRKESSGIEHSISKLIPYKLLECIYIVEESEIEGDIEYFIKTYPWVKFLIFSGSPAPGVKINAASRELEAGYFCVFWDDMLISSGITPKLLQWLNLYKPVCTAPLLYHSEDLIPAITVPAFHDSQFTTLAFVPFRDQAETLFPSDYCGIYDRAVFLRLQGFCEDFIQPYWQLADFGVRSWLSEKSILCCNGFSCTYDSEVPFLDLTVGQEYELFRKRNASFIFDSFEKIVFRRNFVFRKLLNRSGKSEIRELHHRAKKDLFTLIENWEAPEEDLKV